MKCCILSGEMSKVPKVPDSAGLPDTDVGEDEGDFRQAIKYEMKTRRVRRLRERKRLRRRLRG